MKWHSHSDTLRTIIKHRDEEHSHNHTLRTITQHRDEETQPQSHTEDHHTLRRWRDMATITHWEPLHSTEMKRHNHNHTLRTITQNRDEETQSQPHTENPYTAPRWRDTATITHWGPLHSTEMKRNSHNHTLRTIIKHRDEYTQPLSHTDDHNTAPRWRDTATISHWWP